MRQRPLKEIGRGLRQSRDNRSSSIGALPTGCPPTKEVVVLDSQPMHFANSVTIRRPPSEVFAFLVDPANIPKWNYAIDSARQVNPGPVGVGTRIQQTRSVPRPTTEELVITELAPDRRLVLEGDIGPLSGTLSYQIEEVLEGTRLTNTADLSGRGPLRLLAPLAASRVRDAVAANLGKLRDLLESSA